MFDDRMVSASLSTMLFEQVPTPLDITAGATYTCPALNTIQASEVIGGSDYIEFSIRLLASATTALGSVTLSIFDADTLDTLFTPFDLAATTPTGATEYDFKYRVPVSWGGNGNGNKARAIHNMSFSIAFGASAITVTPYVTAKFYGGFKVVK